jgi:hypothetical protein
MQKRFKSAVTGETQKGARADKNKKDQAFENTGSAPKFHVKTRETLGEVNLTDLTPALTTFFKTATSNCGEIRFSLHCDLGQVLTCRYVNDRAYHRVPCRLYYRDLGRAYRRVLPYDIPPDVSDNAAHIHYYTTCRERNRRVGRKHYIWRRTSSNFLHGRAVRTDKSALQ